jgi:hypothetical protein
MSDERTVWLVTEGDYEDRSVVAVVYTEADARELVALGYGDAYQAQALRPIGWRPVRHSYWIVTAAVAKTEPHDRPLEAFEYVSWADDPDQVMFAGISANFDKLDAKPVEVRNHANQNRIDLRCSSLDRERAVKTVSDAVAKLKAERTAGRSGIVLDWAIILKQPELEES